MDKEEQTMIERAMEQAQEANRVKSLQEFNFAAGLMNWRPACNSKHKRDKILRGHAKMLRLIARALK